MINWIVLVIFCVLRAAADEPATVPVCRDDLKLNERPNNEQAPLSSLAVLPSSESKLSIVLAANGSWPMYSMFTPGTEMIRCSIKLTTCPWCVISLKVEPVIAHFSEFQKESLSKCDQIAGQQSCFGLLLIEENADQDVISNGGRIQFKDSFRRTSLFNMSGSEYQTTGSSLTIVVFMRSLEADMQLFDYVLHLFPIGVTAHSNAVIIEGSPFPTAPNPEQTAVGVIESPRYPSAYPQQLVQNVTLVNKNSTGFVRLTFDDFHISQRSELRILDSNDRLLFTTIGEHRRPPPLVSSGPRIRIIFLANGATALIGFRAKYQFVAQQSWPQMPNCDGNLENTGGLITLNDRNELIGQFVDCIWIIAQFSPFSHSFDQILLKVEDFALDGKGVSLEIRNGTSTAPLLLFLTLPLNSKELSQRKPIDEFVTVDGAQHVAFYIRLRGQLSSIDRFQLVYTQFYRWATASCLHDEFHCSGKCIDKQLICDGVDNCGDGIDEQCDNSRLPPIIRDEVTDNEMLSLKAPMIFTIIMILILLVCTIVGLVLLTRLGRRPMQIFFGNQRPTWIWRSQPTCPATHSSELESGANESVGEYGSIHTIGERRFYVLPETSIIEAPPSYDEAIKHPTLHVSRSVDQSYVNGGFSTTETIRDDTQSLTEINVERADQRPNDEDQRSQSTPTNSLEDDQQRVNEIEDWV
ncbi:Low-density lipoprotein receptor domain class A [Aphelenchoides besseyi]|nr:Low-density lipoprotein receptor domain class A [Aphelenchoides besseyi]KAI6208110.1 Low-density lipoprotein receptor domain class A [Aphelenchoides besseyi]